MTATAMTATAMTATAMTATAMTATAMTATAMTAGCNDSNWTLHTATPPHTHLITTSTTRSYSHAHNSLSSHLSLSQYLHTQLNGLSHVRRKMAFEQSTTQQPHAFALSLWLSLCLSYFSHCISHCPSRIGLRNPTATPRQQLDPSHCNSTSYSHAHNSLSAHLSLSQYPSVQLDYVPSAALQLIPVVVVLDEFGGEPLLPSIVTRTLTSIFKSRKHSCYIQPPQHQHRTHKAQQARARARARTPTLQSLSGEHEPVSQSVSLMVRISLRI